MTTAKDEISSTPSPVKAFTPEVQAGARAFVEYVHPGTTITNPDWDEMDQRDRDVYCAAFAAGLDAQWQPLSDAPHGEWLILCTRTGWSSEAILCVNNDGVGEWFWKGEDRPMHANHIPLGWQHFPKPLEDAAAINHITESAKVCPECGTVNCNDKLCRAT